MWVQVPPSAPGFKLRISIRNSLFLIKIRRIFIKKIVILDVEIGRLEEVEKAIYYDIINSDL